MYSCGMMNSHAVDALSIIVTVLAWCFFLFCMIFLEEPFIRIYSRLVFLCSDIFSIMQYVLTSIYLCAYFKHVYFQFDDQLGINAQE